MNSNHSTYRASGRIILSITYGIPLSEVDDFVETARKTMHRIGESVLPGTYMADLVNLLPWCTFTFGLRWFTFARYETPDSFLSFL